MINTYYVWRRSDGTVGATTYDPNRMHFPNHTFEIILVTQDWDEVWDRIDHERN